MTLLERKMVSILKDLKENHNVTGVKAEFEAEGSRIEETLRLKDVISKAGLELTIKVGGCEALKDMFEARTIGVKDLVGPMIESAFALRKFLQATKTAYPIDELEDVEFFINIETITTYKNLAEILNCDLIGELDGIVVGRGDLSESLGRSRDYINSEEVFNITKDILVSAKKKGLKTGLGGGVSVDTLPFLRKLPDGCLDFFETRKVKFKCPESIYSLDAEEAILKAVDFEMMWLKNKRDYYGNIYNEDLERLKTLETRHRKRLVTV